MTNNFVTDTTYGSRSLLMNIKTGQWDNDLLNMFGIAREKLCKLVQAGSICGKISAEFSAITGIPKGIPVVTAGGDQQCSALGLGVLGTGDAEITTGTGAFLLAGLDSFPENLENNIICSASAIKGRYLLESSVLTCCSAFDWFLKNFYAPCECNPYELINQEAYESHDNDILLLPYFQGRATPDWNSKAQATFHGITLSTTRGDFARAILEGICYELQCNLSIIEQYTAPLKSIYICGGLTKNKFFAQLEADILRLPLTRYENCESTALGAWIQAMMALEQFSDYKTAVDTARDKNCKTIFTPNNEKQEEYQEKIKRFNQLYKKLYI